MSETMTRASRLAASSVSMTATTLLRQPDNRPRAAELRPPGRIAMGFEPPRGPRAGSSLRHHPRTARQHADLLARFAQHLQESVIVSEERTGNWNLSQRRP